MTYVMTPFEEAMKNLDDARCQRCLGYGTIDDAAPGDISYNTWKCSKCDGTGFKNGKLYYLESKGKSGKL